MFRTLTGRMLAFVVPLLLIIVVAAVITMLNLLRVEQHINYLGRETIEQVQLTGEYNAEMQRVITEITSYTYSGNPEEAEEAHESLERLAGINEALTVMAEDLHTAETTEHHEVEELQQQRTDLLTLLRRELRGTEQQWARGGVRTPEATMERLEELEESGEVLHAEGTDHLDEDVGLTLQQALTAMQVGLFSTGGVLTFILLLLLLSVLVLQRRIIHPVRQVSQAAVAATGNDLSQRVAVTSRDEIGTLQRSFNQMVESLQEQRDQLQQRNAELADQQAALERALEELQQTSAERTALLENTVEQLSAPILPVQRGILVMPIIGWVSEERAQRLQTTLLQAIERQQARVVIIDVTGLTSVDTAVVQALMQTVQCSLLLGARPILVGIDPLMASSLVALGTPLHHMHTMADLEAAIQVALLNGAP